MKLKTADKFFKWKHVFVPTGFSGLLFIAGAPALAAMLPPVAMHYKPVVPTMLSVTWRRPPPPIPITSFLTGFA